MCSTNSLIGIPAVGVFAVCEVSETGACASTTRGDTGRGATTAARTNRPVRLSARTEVTRRAGTGTVAPESAAATSVIIAHLKQKCMVLFRRGDKIRSFIIAFWGRVRNRPFWGQAVEPLDFRSAVN